MQLKFLKRNISKIVAIFCTYCLCVMPVDAAITTTYKIDYIKYPQQKSNWCWVASAECSGKHLRYTDRTQIGAVTEIIGYPANYVGTMNQIALAAEYFTHNTYNYVAESRKYPCELFTVQIMNNYIPIAAAGYYDSNGKRNGGHATPVHAVHRLSSGVKLIGYYDPGLDLRTCTNRL